MIILAIDPGTTVGYSVYNTEKDTIDYNQVPNQVFPQILHHYMPVDVVVYERYHIERVGQETIAAEVIGMLRFCEYFWDSKLVTQEPSALKFIDNMFQWKKRRFINRGIHSFDAFRHLLFYLYKNNGKELVEKVLNEVTL